jgi:hypothetical protein
MQPRTAGFAIETFRIKWQDWITKQFTPVAILQLAEAGKLSVQDPVSKFYSQALASWPAITVQQLLTHTSGLPNNELKDFTKGDSCPVHAGGTDPDISKQAARICARNEVGLYEHRILPLGLHHRTSVRPTIRHIPVRVHFRAVGDGELRIRALSGGGTQNGRGIYIQERTEHCATVTTSTAHWK